MFSFALGAQATVEYEGLVRTIYDFQQLAAGLLAVVAALAAIVVVVVDHRIKADREQKKRVAIAANFLSYLKYRMDNSVEALEAIENVVEAVRETTNASEQLSLLRNLNLIPKADALFEIEDRDFGLGYTFASLCFEYQEILVCVNEKVDKLRSIKAALRAVPNVQNQLTMDALLRDDSAAFQEDLETLLNELEAHHTGCIELAQEIQSRIDFALGQVNYAPDIEI